MIQFTPSNEIVKLCLQGMELEGQDKGAEAQNVFHKAWTNSTDDFERFLSAFFVARTQTDISDQLRWYEKSLQYASKLEDVAVRSALPTLYLNIAKRHEALQNFDEAKKNYERSASFSRSLKDDGPFYHGTKANLKVGDFLTAGGESNYKADLKMNHIYFTGSVDGAGLAAALAKGEGRERIYIVEPTGYFENDPNVTDKKFPGNLTRSYRSIEPLKIVGEVTDRAGQISEEIHNWRQKLAKNKGEIIN